jgi:hypothetical protein
LPVPAHARLRLRSTAIIARQWSAAKGQIVRQAQPTSPFPCMCSNRPVELTFGDGKYESSACLTRSPVDNLTAPQTVLYNPEYANGKD